MSINKIILKKFVEEGFFDELKHLDQIVTKLDTRGHSLKGKQVSLLSQLLTLLCRDGIIERHKNPEGEWEYIKR